MNWSKERTDEFNRYVIEQLSQERLNQIDARATLLFINMWILGLMPKGMAKTATDLTGDDLAKMRMLVMMMEPVWANTAANNR